jgi:hypothetical protein
MTRLLRQALGHLGRADRRLPQLGSTATSHVIAFPMLMSAPELSTETHQRNENVLWSDFPDDVLRRLRELRGPEWWR